MMGWTEADFSYDVTGGVDFMANVRNQVTAIGMTEIRTPFLPF